MTYSAVMFRLAALAIACVPCVGCITVNSGAKAAANDPNSSPNALMAWFKPKMTIPDEKPVIVPDKLSNERELAIRYAQWMVEIGKLDEASEKYKSVLKKNPKDVDAVIGLAKIDEICGRTEQAEKGYRKAVELQPDAAVPQLALGNYFASQKRWPESIDSYNRAVLADPIDRKARFELAKALVHNGDVEGALPHFKRTVPDAEAHFNTALILREEGRLPEAEQQLRIAISKKPELQQARLLLAEIVRPQRWAMNRDEQFQRASHAESPQTPAATPMINPGRAVSAAQQPPANYAIAGYSTGPLAY